MKTRILLIGLIIFLVNVISVNAKEKIKTCGISSRYKNFNYFWFPDDGGKPHGATVEILLSFTNPLNLEIEFVQEKEHKDDFAKNCLDKLRSGQIDVMPWVDDTTETRNYAELVPHYKCPKSWKCKGNGHANFGISKKSKFASRVNEFKSAVLSQDDYAVILNTNFTSADQHNWDRRIVDYLVKDTLKICLRNEHINENTFVFVKFANKKAYGVFPDVGAYYANKMGLKPEYVNGVHNFEERCHVCFNCSNTLNKKHYLHYYRPEWKDSFMLVNKKYKTSKGVSLVDEIKRIELNPTMTGILWELYAKYMYVQDIDRKIAHDKEQAAIPDVEKGKKNLGAFYTVYLSLKRCHEVRKGYEVVFVNSYEMEKIKSNAKKIETSIIKEYPEVESLKDKIWKEATKPISLMQLLLLTSERKTFTGTIQVTSDLSNREICTNLKNGYESLIQKTGGGAAEKDF